MTPLYPHPNQPTPRHAFPDERWHECVREEQAYTDGWREGLTGATTYRAPRGTLTKGQQAFRLGHGDGSRARVVRGRTV
jgi:hypothetical protein